MRYDQRFSQFMICGLAAASFSVPAVSFADVTPEDVWADMSKYYEAYGYQMAGDQTRVGDTLVIDNMVLSMAFPEEEGSFSFSADKVVLTDLGDGTVSMAFPDSMPISVQVKPADEPPVDITLDYRLNDVSIIASGAPDDMLYTFEGAGIAIELTDLAINGISIGNNVAYFLLNMDGVSGTATTVSEEGFNKLAESIVAENITYKMNFADPETGDTGAFSGSMTDTRVKLSSDMPEGVDPNDMQASLDAGMSGGILMDFASSTMIGTFTSKSEGDGTFNTSSAGGHYELSVSNNGMVIEGKAAETKTDLMTPEFPLPLSYSVGNSAFALKMPIVASEEEQMFNLGLTLADLEMSEMIWSMFDPQAALPRDPMTLDLGVSGYVLSELDFFDVEAMAALENTNEAPGEIRSLSLDRLRVNVLGAELTGEGGFTFDNSDMETFDGVPRPEGRIALGLTGANAVLDKLGELGFISPDDLMGARMMLGMFTIPAGDDSVTTTVEINEQGHVIANGQRIQ